MLLNAKLYFSLWGETILTVCYVLHRIPLKKNKISLCSLWKGKKPNIGYFKVWGCLSYCKSMYSKMIKLGPRAIKCALVRYATNSKAIDY